MNKQQIMDYCASKSGAVYDFQQDWNAGRYTVFGKMFVLIGGDKEETPVVSLKCDSALAALLREQYADVIPGYYLNKANWNSVYYERGTVPDDELKHMIDMSYDLICAKLTKKQKAEI